MRRCAVLGLVAGVVALMGACSSSNSTATTAAGGGSATTQEKVVEVQPDGATAAATVSIAEFSFKEASVSIKVNDVVTWNNTGGVGHTTSSDKTGQWDSKTLSSGKTFSLKFLKAGTYSYHCNIHPSMKASITVA